MFCAIWTPVTSCVKSPVPPPHDPSTATCIRKPIHCRPGACTPLNCPDRLSLFVASWLPPGHGDAHLFQPCRDKAARPTLYHQPLKGGIRFWQQAFRFVCRWFVMDGHCQHPHNCLKSGQPNVRIETCGNMQPSPVDCGHCIALEASSRHAHHPVDAFGLPLHFPR